MNTAAYLHYLHQFRGVRNQQTAPYLVSFLYLYFTVSIQRMQKGLAGM